jgi:hypothetical protein
VTRNEVLAIAHAVRRSLAAKGYGNGETIRQEALANGATRLEFPPPQVVNQVQPAQVYNQVIPAEVPVVVNCEAPNMEAVQALVRETNGIAAQMVDAVRGVESMLSQLVQLLHAQSEIKPPVVEFKPTIQPAEVSVLSQAAPARPKRKMTIAHDDGTKSTVTIE